MFFKGLGDFTNSLLEVGSYQISNVFKASIPSPGSADQWLDLSMSSGIPKYNAYVGSQLESTQLNGLGNNGIYCGEDTLPGIDRYLFTWGARAVSAAVPMYLMLCDYLLFYPLIDLDSSDEQVMANITSLPRYVDGVGVRMMLVTSTPSTIPADVSITYINNYNIEKTIVTRILASSTGVLMTTAATTGAAVGRSPFVPLSMGCLGVKSIVKVTVLTPAGGFCNIVLVKPLAHLNIFESNTFSEINFVNDKLVLPKIQNGAYLNIISHNQNSGAVPFQSELLFITR